MQEESSMYWGAILIIEVTKLYFTVFQFFRYEKVKSIKKMLCISVLFLIVFGFANEYFGLNDTYLTYVAGSMAVGIIVIALSNVKKIGEIFLFYMVICVIDIMLTGLIIMFLGLNVEYVLASRFRSLIFNSINMFVIIIFITGNNSLGRHKNSFRVKLTKSEVFILTVGIISGGVCIGLLQNIEYVDNIKWTRYILLTTSISIALFIALITRLMVKQRYYEKINTMERELNEQQQQYHRELIKKEINTKKFHHDLSEHLYCISRLCEKGMHTQLNQYINDLQEAYNEISPYVSTGNYVVDVISNDLYNKYKEKNIKLIWRGKIPENIAMTDMDICALFANLLKNAYESTVKVDSYNSREVCVDVKNLESNIIICISNPVDSRVKHHAGRLLTTKRNKEIHGFGNLIVQDTIKKYNGMIKYVVKNDMFKVEIVIRDILESSNFVEGK